MDVCLGCPAALLDLDENGRYFCGVTVINGKLLLTGKSAKAPTGQSDFAVRSGQSPRYYFIVTGDVSAQLWVTLGPYIS